MVRGAEVKKNSGNVLWFREKVVNLQAVKSNYFTGTTNCLEISKNIQQ